MCPVNVSIFLILMGKGTQWHGFTHIQELKTPTMGVPDLSSEHQSLYLNIEYLNIFPWMSK